MKNIVLKIILSIIGVCFNTMVSATSCLPVQGTVETQSINDSEQVGRITMTSSRPLAFRQAFGQFNITGGIKGAITGPTPTGVALEHHFGFPGVGSIISTNDTASFTGPADSQGNTPVTETVPITATTAYSGEFSGWTGQLVATGAVNFTTGSNTFIYTGNLCHS